MGKTVDFSGSLTVLKKIRSVKEKYLTPYKNMVHLKKERNGYGKRKFKERFCKPGR